MNSFSDNQFKNANPTFVVQQNGNMFFLISVQSSPQVTVSGLSVNQVTISSTHLPGGGVVLYDSINSSPNPVTSNGVTFNYNAATFTLPSGVYAGFSVGEVSAWNVVQDTLDAVTVQAKVTISYQGGQKRHVEAEFQTGSQTTYGSTSSMIQLQHTAASSSIVAHVVGIVVVALMLFV